jgi:hypothetical protein
MTRVSRTEAFTVYKAKPRNPYWGLSARSEKLRLVVISLWQDEIRGKAGRMFCERPGWGDWYDGPRQDRVHGGPPVGLREHRRARAARGVGSHSNRKGVGPNRQLRPSQRGHAYRLPRCH